MSKIHTYLFFKPYNCLSQFTREHPDHVTLADFLQVESNVYPIGRLDKDSEGLLLLSSDKSLVNNILNPTKKLYKTYWAQVEGQITEQAIEQLKKGVIIRIKGKDYTTLPAIILAEQPPLFPDRIPPIRFRKTIPTSWIGIQICEGKNRQVRRMLAKVGFPVLRLIRTAIGPYSLGALKPTEWIKL